MLCASTGCTMTHAQRKQKAEQHWGQVRAKVKLQMATQQFDRGMTADALKLLDEALTWDPDNPDALLLLARCRLEQGKLASAERAVQRAAQFAVVEDGRISAARGMIAERHGDYVAAIQHYQRARAFDDSEMTYLVSEAESLVALGRTADARALIEQGIVDYDNNPTLHALLGELALSEGRKEDAMRSFRSVLTAGKYDPVIAEEYALLATQAGQHREALNVLKPLVARRDEVDVPASVLRATAESQLALHQYEPAKEVLSSLVERYPDDAGAWMLLARAGISSHDAPTTRRSANQLRRLAPRDPQSMIIEAYACMQENQFRSAEAALRRALVLNGENVLTWCMLGLVAEKNREYEKAKAHYREALKRDGQCQWALAALQRIASEEAARSARANVKRENQPLRALTAKSTPEVDE